MAALWSWEPGDGVTRLVLTGELDLDTSGGLAGDDLIVVDTAAVTFIDSSGLRALLELGSTPGERVRFGPFSPSVERLVELTGTSQLLPR